MTRRFVALCGITVSSLGSSTAIFGCRVERKRVDLVLDVWMNQSLQRIIGRSWPLTKTGVPAGMTTVPQPCTVRLHLPSARTLQLEATQLILQQEEGIVTLVSVLPLHEAVDFGTAIGRAEEITRGLGLQDRKFFETMEHWRDAPPSAELFDPKYMVRVAVESGVNLYVRIKPTSDQSRWFIALEFHKAAAPR